MGTWSSTAMPETTWSCTLLARLTLRSWSLYHSSLSSSWGYRLSFASCRLLFPSSQAPRSPSPSRCPTQSTQPPSSPLGSTNLPSPASPAPTTHWPWLACHLHPSVPHQLSTPRTYDLCVVFPKNIKNRHLLSVGYLDFGDSNSGAIPDKLYDPGRVHLWASVSSST